MREQPFNAEQADKEKQKRRRDYTSVHVNRETAEMIDGQLERHVTRAEKTTKALLLRRAIMILARLTPVEQTEILQRDPLA